jgi:hypothetical protein
LFHISQVTSALFCLGGNALSILAAFDRELTNGIGFALAGLNLSFAALFLLGYSLELRKEKIKEELKTDVNEWRAVVGEWNYILVVLERVGDHENRRKKLLDGLPYIRSHVIMAIRNKLKNTEIKLEELLPVACQGLRVGIGLNGLKTLEEEVDTKARAAVRESQNILERVNTEFETVMGFKPSRSHSVAEFVSMEHLERLSGVSGGGEGLVNPLRDPELGPVELLENGFKEKVRTGSVDKKKLKQLESFGPKKGAARSGPRRKKSKKVDSPPPPPPPPPPPSKSLLRFGWLTFFDQKKGVSYWKHESSGKISFVDPDNLNGDEELVNPLPRAGADTDSLELTAIKSSGGGFEDT